MKTKDILITAAVGGIAYFLYNKYKEKQASDSQVTVTSDTSGDAGGGTDPNVGGGIISQLPDDHGIEISSHWGHDGGFAATSNLIMNGR